MNLIEQESKVWSLTVGRSNGEAPDVEVGEEGVEQLGQLGLVVVLGLGDPELEGSVLGLGGRVVWVGGGHEVTMWGRS